MIKIEVAHKSQERAFDKSPKLEQSLNMAIISDKIEQEHLKYSGRILASCLLHLEKMLKPGLKAEEINLFSEKFIRSYEAVPPFLGYYGFPHSICVSINDEVVHALAEDKILQAGDLVSLDLGVAYKELYTDAARTFLITEDGIDEQSTTDFLELLNSIEFKASFPAEKSFGRPSFFGANVHTASREDKLKLIQATHLGLFEGIRPLKSGSKVGDIGQAVNDWIKFYGYGNVTALGGHGVGRSLHEEPYIPHVGKKGSGKLLIENLVIAIEPMITMSDGRNVKFEAKNKYKWDVVKTSDSSLACHFEDTVILTKKGHQILTRVDKTEILPILDL